MFPIHWIRNLRAGRAQFSTIPLMILALTFLTMGVPRLPAQDQSGSATSGQKQEAPPEAGGPQNDVGPYAIPKKKEEPPPHRRQQSPRRLRECLTIPSRWTFRW